MSVALRKLRPEKKGFYRSGAATEWLTGCRRSDPQMPERRLPAKVAVVVWAEVGAHCTFVICHWRRNILAHQVDVAVVCDEFTAGTGAVIDNSRRDGGCRAARAVQNVDASGGINVRRRTVHIWRHAVCLRAVVIHRKIKRIGRHHEGCRAVAHVGLCWRHDGCRATQVGCRRNAQNVQNFPVRLVGRGGRCADRQQQGAHDCGREAEEQKFGFHFDLLNWLVVE